MKRKNILNLFSNYKTTDIEENKMIKQTIKFIDDNIDCFERSLLEGHVTGSAWVMDAEKRHVLLIHHLKLNRWFQPGGHCDGDSDVLNVAVREVHEETGLNPLVLDRQIFDVDIHLIPSKGCEPEHLHYDIRFLLEGSKEFPLIVTPETKDIRWVELNKVALLNNSESIVRMVRKSLLFS